ncbi:MAG: DegT/DnrJ/EryC1/StrS family aminotransferase [Chloroflexi bacterium]|nr:DegT/DnrJ/EryC1/StrS family aminotransferase [Chloroflexota bacterium]MCY4105721.1 DegT/DnrJ/EryC1/StrS family aminotransferase [Chloroflexota bacterium]
MAQLALHGGPTTKSKPFPAWPHYDEREERALLSVLHSHNWWRGAGQQTAQFERDFAAAHGAKHGIACTNGTHALEICIAALGIGQGDEVIVPNFTFVATASAVLSSGALPVLVDVSPKTYCLNVSEVEAAITPQTRAIITVHMGGCVDQIEELAALAARHDIALIEDCAHAHGSEWQGRRVGVFGIAGTFSFQQSKSMTAGEGGIIIINDDDFECRARSAHDCGRLPGEYFYEHFGYGSNYRLSEWQGAILGVQLERLEEQSAQRHQNARLLDDLLGELDGITPQTLPEGCTRDGHYAYIFHVETSAFAGAEVKEIITALNAEGIPTQDSYPPLHRLAMFATDAYRQRLGPQQADGNHEFMNAPFPGTERGAYETIWIPQYALLGDTQDMEEIGLALQKIQRRSAELGK